MARLTNMVMVIQVMKLRAVQEEILWNVSFLSRRKHSFDIMYTHRGGHQVRIGGGVRGRYKEWGDGHN